MSCPKYAHEQCYVLNDYSSRLSISSSTATQRPVYHSRPATVVEVSASFALYIILSRDYMVSFDLTKSPAA